VYFDYKDSETQNVINVAANILKQLLSHFADIPNDLMELLYDMRSNARHSLDVSSITKVINAIVPRFASVYVVVDALDECESYTAREQFLKFVERLEEDNAKTLMTGRPHVQPHKYADILPIQAQDQDIETYIRFKLEDTRIKPELQEEIITKLLQTAGGTFVNLLN
jgi:hypothetical protein